MALVNDVKKEIHAKIVYYGPGRAGKTTNLEYIYNKLKPEYRGKFKFLNTPSGKMVFFDFMRPELAGVKDYSIHFHLYTVPGDATESAVWKNVLKGVDGIVFVADLDSSRTLENRRSLEDLKSYLDAQETGLAEVSCIFQFNKKDVAGDSAPDDLKNLLDVGDIPVMTAAAGSGEGVLPTLSEMVKMVLQKLRDTSLVSEEQAVVSDESAYDQEAPPEEAPPVSESAYAFSQETECLDSFGVEEESLADESPTVEFSLSEEPEIPADAMDFSTEISGSPDILDTLSDESVVPPVVCDEESIGFPEPEYDVVPSTFENVTDESGFEVAEPEISLGGDLEFLGDGRYRLPLVIRYADKEKRTALTLSLGIE